MEKFKFNQQTKNLFKAISSLKTPEETKDFFRDLCTIDEIKEMSERWEIANLLDKGWSYRKIAEKMKVSTTTVSRVSLWLNNGTGGYKSMLERFNHHRKTPPDGKGLR